MIFSRLKIHYKIFWYIYTYYYYEVVLNLFLSIFFLFSKITENILIKLKTGKMSIKRGKNDAAHSGMIKNHFFFWTLLIDTKSINDIIIEQLRGFNFITNKNADTFELEFKNSYL